MAYYKPTDVGKVWGEWFETDAFSVEKRQRRIFRVLPHSPRCKFWNAPFEGVGGAIIRAVYGKKRSILNPRFCNLCEEASRRYPGGAEVQMSMLFADVRGSTALSEQMSPTEFSRLINRFFTESTKIISEADGLLEQLSGDAVVAFWGAGFAGPDYVRRTIAVAEKLAKAMAQQDIPVGVGVHAGVAYFGAFGETEGLMNIAAIGDEVNLAARLGSQAGAGEIIISEQALAKAGLPAEGMDSRNLELKGISQLVPVRVIHV